MGSLANSLCNHRISAGFEDNARWCHGAEPANWGVDEDSVTLCSRECITDNYSACHDESELRCPSRISVTEFVLPMKIHFRHCWLFSGVPWRNTQHSRGRSEPLTDRELVRCNRILMTGDEPELCSQVHCENLACRGEMKAFWLTTGAQLVRVDRPSEDIKFRYIRERNLRVGMSLWTSNPELCGQTMRAASAAHENLIRICGEAALFSRGKFYNVYANYPLPINTERERRACSDSHWLEEKDICATEIRNGQELLVELQPLYAEYFSFIMDNSTSDTLKERVTLLGAQWLIEEDRSELLFSLDIKRNWLKRMALRLALFLSVS